MAYLFDLLAVMPSIPSLASSSGDLWNREVFTDGSTTESRLVANDPLRKGVAVRTRPVSVGFGEGVVVWGGFNLLRDADRIIPNPSLD